MFKIFRHVSWPSDLHHVIQSDALLLLTVMPKQELLLLMSATYPPRFQPGQQSTGPFVSQRSRNCGALRRCVDSSVHIDRMAECVNRSPLKEGK